MKTYTNSKGESLPKVICAVIEFENKRLGDEPLSDKLIDGFNWNESIIFGTNVQTNIDNWINIDDGDYQKFYSIFPTCKNSRGQELPEDIQVEIVQEMLRQGIEETKVFSGTFFDWDISEKGYDYWNEIYHHTDYKNHLPTQSEPTKSDDTFTQGEIVEVSDTKDFKHSLKHAFVCTYKGIHIVYNEEDNIAYNPNYIRKIQPLELTLPELLTIAEKVKGTKVKLKS